MLYNSSFCARQTPEYIICQNTYTYFRRGLLGIKNFSGWNKDWGCAYGKHCDSFVQFTQQPFIECCYMPGYRKDNICLLNTHRLSDVSAFIVKMKELDEWPLKTSPSKNRFSIMHFAYVQVMPKDFSSCINNQTWAFCR